MYIWSSLPHVRRARHDGFEIVIFWMSEGDEASAMPAVHHYLTTRPDASNENLLDPLHLSNKAVYTRYIPGSCRCCLDYAVWPNSYRLALHHAIWVVDVLARLSRQNGFQG